MVVVVNRNNRLFNRKKVLNALLMGLRIVPFFQPNRTRFILALCYTVPIVVQDVLFSDVDGHIYFLTDAVGCLISATLINGVVDGGKVAQSLQALCLASCVGNFVGWVMWNLYMSPLAYESFYLLLYAYALMVLTTGTGANVGIHRHNWFSINVRVNRT